MKSWWSTKNQRKVNLSSSLNCLATSLQNNQIYVKWVSSWVRYIYTLWNSTGLAVSVLNRPKSFETDLPIVRISWWSPYSIKHRAVWLCLVRHRIWFWSRVFNQHTRPWCPWFETRRYSIHRSHRIGNTDQHAKGKSMPSLYCMRMQVSDV